MGYRDDFYCVDNMIGFSGQLHNYPSVYFLTDKEYGHITQMHGYGQNVGRHQPKSANGYFIGNEMVKGVLKLVEKRNGRVFHESRSILTRVEDIDEESLAILKQAIWLYPNDKYITSFSKSIRKDIAASKAAKSNFHDLLTQGLPKLRHV